MIVAVLILILTGSLSGAVALWLQGAPLWQIALGYVAGGWAGLLAGLPVMLALRALWSLLRGRRRRDPVSPAAAGSRTSAARPPGR